MSPVDLRHARLTPSCARPKSASRTLGVRLHLSMAPARFSTRAREARSWRSAAKLFAARNIQLHNGGFCSCNSQLGWQGHLKRPRRDLTGDRAPRSLQYKRYQIDGGRHRGDTEKTYESYG